MQIAQERDMIQAAPIQARREPAMFYRRLELKLDVTSLHSDRDLARIVEERLPLSSVDSLHPRHDR